MEKNTEGQILTKDHYQRLEEFVNKNGNYITAAAVILVLIVGGMIGYKNFYVAPMDQEARVQIIGVQKYFDRQNWELVLNGDGNYLGALDIIDEYGPTKTANLARYYAGVSYLHLGYFNEAIQMLDKFNSKDKIVSAMALGAIGDAYMELGDTDRGIRYYKRAASHNSNAFTSPVFLMKAGNALELAGNFRDAKKKYEKVRNDYPESMEANDAEKLIARVDAKL